MEVSRWNYRGCSPLHYPIFYLELTSSISMIFCFCIKGIYLFIFFFKAEEKRLTERNGRNIFEGRAVKNKRDLSSKLSPDNEQWEQLYPLNHASLDSSASWISSSVYWNTANKMMLITQVKQDAYISIQLNGKMFVNLGAVLEVLACSSVPVELWCPHGCRPCSQDLWEKQGLHLLHQCCVSGSRFS